MTTPIQLARPGMFGRLRDRLFGPKAESRSELDGIVHTGKDKYPQAMAERSAIAGALQHLGYNNTNAHTHRQDVDKHVRVAAWLAQHKPDLLPVKHYVEKASKLQSPDVVGQEGRYHTVDVQGPAGMELTQAAVPLTRFVNHLLSNMGQSKPLPGSRIQDTGVPEDTRESEVTQPTPEYTQQIPPADDSLPLIPLADMRRRLPKESQLPTMPYQVVDETDKSIPMSNFKGEIGKSGARWNTVRELLSSGGNRVAIARTLMDRFGMTPRNAAALIRRFKKSNPDAKLARQSPLVVDPDIKGTRLEAHLRSLAKEFSGEPHMLALVRAALTGKTDQGEYQTGNDPFKEIGLYLQNMKWYSDQPGRENELRNSNAYRLAKAYNWDRVQQGLGDERLVRSFLQQHVQNPAGIQDLHEKAARSYDLVNGRGNNKDEFWTRLRQYAGQYGMGDQRTNERLNNALLRLANKDIERRESSSDPDWRKQKQWLPGSRHMKFARPRVVAPALEAIQQNPRLIVKHPDFWGFLKHDARDNDHSGSGGNAAARQSLADWLHERYHPLWTLVQRTIDESSGFPQINTERVGQYSRDYPKIDLLNSFGGKSPTAADIRKSHSFVMVGIHNGQPALGWQTRLPKGKEQGGKLSVMSAAVTPDELHDFIDVAVPEGNQQEWRNFAERQGWHRGGNQS